MKNVSSNFLPNRQT